MSPAPAFRSVVFDCDSTLSSIEGIDALCRALPPPRAREVAALTAAAMDGRAPLAEVYARRLEIVRPSREDLEVVGRRYVDTLVPGAREVVEGLLDADVRVGIVSGGLAAAVQILAADLGLDAASVHAVGVTFDEAGRYVDFDRASPLARNHGKVEVLRGLRAERAPLLFIGDGVTDLEAKDEVDLFVGFGGVARRAAVEKAADVYYADADLGFVLNLVRSGPPAR